jgi:hypothetical protein
MTELREGQGQHAAPIELQQTTEFAAVVPVAPPLLPVAVEAAGESISCPECGTLATISINRREASDFCRTCDYPLFWVPNRITLDGSLDSDGRSLRRLPGTVGRATVAALACPHCNEPNAVSAQVCVRCGLSLHPLPPAPEVVYVPAPLPEPVAEPVKSHIPWWVWVLVFLALSGAIALITFLLLKEMS